MDHGSKFSHLFFRFAVRPNRTEFLDPEDRQVSRQGFALGGDCAILGKGVGDGEIKRRSFLPPQRQKKYEVYVCYIDLRASNTFRYYSVDQGWYLNRIIQR